MSTLITKKTKVIFQGFVATATTLGVVMPVSLSRHTATRIMCNFVEEVIR
jgi:hypothetical protein